MLSEKSKPAYPSAGIMQGLNLVYFYNKSLTGLDLPNVSKKKERTF